MSIDLPEGWVVHPAPGIAFLAVSPEAADGAHASVVVSIRRVASELTLDDLTGLIGDEIAEIPGATVTDERTVSIGDRPAALRQFEIPSDEGGSVAHQLQVICLAAVTDHVADAVTMTLSVTEESRLIGEDSLRSIIDSLRID